MAVKPVDVIQDKPGPYDDYGQAYEVGDELAGFVGMRVVNLNPERGLDFKIADYQRGVRNARGLFTRETRLGAGPVTPKEIIDAYINSNRALFEVRRDMMKDYDAAQILGLPEETISKVSRRLSRRDVGTIRNGIFRPLPLSDDVKRAFAENSRKMGVPNPLEVALPVIARIREILSLAPLSLEMFPELFNPFEAPPVDTTKTVPSNIDLNTPAVNPTVVGQGANMTANQNVMQTGLTQTETALLSEEEKAMRLRQRGLA